MAITVAVRQNITVRSGVLGGFKMRIVDFTGDATYAVGGYTITAASCNLDTLVHTIIALGFSATGTYQLSWDFSNKKLMFCRMGAALSLGFAEAGVNEAGVNNTRGTCLVLGY